MDAKVPRGFYIQINYTYKMVKNLKLSLKWTCWVVYYDTLKQKKTLLQPRDTCERFWLEKVGMLFFWYWSL